jgi:hypothetical protein
MAVQNYWGNQNYATMQQQAQYAGMPQQQNYQQAPSGGVQPRPSQPQQSAWGTPSQGSWQSPPPSGGGAAPQQSAQGGQTNWSGQGGWGQPQPGWQPPQQGPPQGGTPPPSWWQQPQQPIMAPWGGWSGGGGGYIPGGYAPPQAGPADYNGYQAPRIAVPQGGSAMPGWDQSKWTDTAHQSPKYVVGHILSQFAPRTSNMQAVVQAIAQAYPGTRLIGDDKISIPGVGETDILQSAGSGGKAWQWLGQSQGRGQAPSSPMGGGGMGGMDPYTAMLMQLMGGGQQYAQPQVQPQVQRAPDVSQYTTQIQQLQTQLQELQAQNQQRRGLNVTYF